MRKFIRDLLTEDDGSTYCAARFAALFSVFAFITAALVHVMHALPMDFSQLGIGFGAVLAGAGVFLGAKAATQK